MPGGPSIWEEAEQFLGRTAELKEHQNCQGDEIYHPVGKHDLGVVRYRAHQMLKSGVILNYAQANIWGTYNSNIVSKDVRLDNLCDDSRVPG